MTRGFRVRAGGRRPFGESPCCCPEAASETDSNLLEAQVQVEHWRIEYNTLRPHSALGYLTPTDYAKAWTANHPHSHHAWTKQPGPSQGRR
jgi:transposase InsO family protein